LLIAAKGNRATRKIEGDALTVWTGTQVPHIVRPNAAIGLHRHRDNQEAFELLVSRQRPMIALCMGEAGLISRVLALFAIKPCDACRKRDGKFHNIRVRVNRPGLTVRARRGYANPSGKAPGPFGTVPNGTMTVG
jgi:hypothetical protein